MVVSPQEVMDWEEKNEDAKSRAQMECLCKEIDALLMKGERSINGDEEFRCGWETTGVKYGNQIVTINSCDPRVCRSLLDAYRQRGWLIEKIEHTRDVGWFFSKEIYDHISYEFHAVPGSVKS